MRTGTWKVNWIKAEDAPDRIPAGAKVLMMRPEWSEPVVQRFNPNYDRSAKACGRIYFAEFEWPEGP